MAATQPYTLYYNKWSICSHMVRLTLAFKGQTKDAESEMIVEEKEVDIFNGAQLTEEYLTVINAKGQVSEALYIRTRDADRAGSSVGPPFETAKTYARQPGYYLLHHDTISQSNPRKYQR